MSADDDYMSNNFLNSKLDHRPGLVSNKLSQLYKRELKHKEHNQWQKQKSHKILEEENRKQGLESAIGQDNKGFQLLQKMGYKPNTGIGRYGTGRIEPVPINLKPSKGGVGQETEKKRRGELIQKMNAEKKIKIEKKFKQSLKSKLEDKETIRDLTKSQKACEQLDSKTGKTEPIEKFYWPKELLKGSKYKGDLSGEDSNEDEEEEDNITELSQTEQLQRLTEYLRTSYFYCIWCAIEFNDSEDMKSNCPGMTSADHDD